MAVMDILFAQLGLDKDEITALAHEAAHVVKSVDARMSRIEANQLRIMAALNIAPVEVEQKGQPEYDQSSIIDG